jgi:hypothetical protein
MACARLDIRQQPDTQINAALLQGQLQGPPVHINQINLHLRIAALEAAEQIRQEVAQDGIGRGDADRAARGLGNQACMPHGVIDGIHHVPGVVKKHLPRRRQRNAMRQAVEQLDLELLLKALHRAGDGGLRHMFLQSRR